MILDDLWLKMFSPNSSKDVSVLCQAPYKVSNLSAAQPIHKFNFNFTLQGK